MIPKEASGWAERGCDVDCLNRDIEPITQSQNLGEVAGEGAGNQRLLRPKATNGQATRAALQLIPEPDAASLLPPAV